MNRDDWFNDLPEKKAERWTARYIEMIDDKINKIPINDEEDFEKIRCALEILLKEDRVEASSPELKERITSIKEMMDEPEGYIDETHYDDFRAIFKFCLGKCVNHYATMHFEKKKEIVEERKKLVVQTRANQAILQKAEPPPPESRTLSEEEWLLQEQQRFQSEIILLATSSPHQATIERLVAQARSGAGSLVVLENISRTLQDPVLSHAIFQAIEGAIAEGAFIGRLLDRGDIPLTLFIPRFHRNEPPRLRLTVEHVDRVVKMLVEAGLLEAQLSSLEGDIMPLLQHHTTLCKLFKSGLPVEGVLSLRGQPESWEEIAQLIDEEAPLVQLLCQGLPLTIFKKTNEVTFMREGDFNLLIADAHRAVLDFLKNGVTEKKILELGAGVKSLFKHACTVLDLMKNYSKPFEEIAKIRRVHLKTMGQYPITMAKVFQPGVSLAEVIKLLDNSKFNSLFNGFGHLDVLIDYNFKFKKIVEIFNALPEHEISRNTAVTHRQFTALARLLTQKHLEISLQQATEWIFDSDIEYGRVDSLVELLILKIAPDQAREWVKDPTYSILSLQAAITLLKAGISPSEIKNLHIKNPKILLQAVAGLVEHGKIPVEELRQLEEQALTLMTTRLPGHIPIIIGRLQREGKEISLTNILATYRK